MATVVNAQSGNGAAIDDKQNHLTRQFAMRESAVTSHAARGSSDMTRRGGGM